MDDNLYFLMDLFTNADMFLLIMVRMLGFFVILPILSGNNLPAIARLGLTMAFALLVYTSGAYGGHAVFFHENVVGFAILVISEFLIGLTMAYVAYVMYSVIYFAGQMMDQDIGFSMVSVMDPMSQIQVPILGNIFFMLALVLLILSGGLHFFLGALFQSYHIAPIGAVWLFEPYQAIPMYVIRLITQSFQLGLQIAMPFMGALLVINLALGMLLKSMPQMNMFVVGMPLKLVLGLLLVAVVLPSFVNVTGLIFNTAFDAMETIIFMFGSTIGMNP